MNCMRLFVGNVGLRSKLAIAKQTQDSSGTQMPTSPCERRVSIHVFRVNCGTCLKKHLNRFLGPERDSTMKRCFCTSSDITRGGPACFKLGAQHKKLSANIELKNDVVPV